MNPPLQTTGLGRETGAVEHYEIASYATVSAWAEKMGHDEAVELLNATLDEERATNEKLSAIAESAADEAGD